MENDKLVRASDIFPALQSAGVPYNYATQRVIEQLPAVDAVEGVVRCRDCVHYYDVLRKGTQFESGSCDRWSDGTAFSPDDYCSHGRAQRGR